MAVGNCNFNTIYHNKRYFLENFIHFVISCNFSKIKFEFFKKSPPCPRVSTEREHVSSQELGSRYRRKSQVSEPWNHFLLESQLPSL